MKKQDKIELIIIWSIAAFTVLSTYFVWKIYTSTPSDKIKEREPIQLQHKQT